MSANEGLPDQPKNSESPEIKRNKLSMEREEESDDSTQKDSSPDVGTPKEDQIEEAEPSGMCNYASFLSPIMGQAFGGALGVGIDPGLVQLTGLPMLNEYFLNAYAAHLNPLAAQPQPPQVPQYPKHLTHFLNNQQLYLKNPIFVQQMDNLIGRHAQLMKEEGVDVPVDPDYASDSSLNLSNASDQGTSSDDGDGESSDFQKLRDLLNRISIPVYPMQPKTFGKQKLTKEEYKALNDIFKEFNELDEKGYALISTWLGVEYSQVRNWFHNKRWREKKKKLRAQED